MSLTGSSWFGVSGEAFEGILDLYPGASAAYSIRRLSSSYTGALLRVRRSSDNLEQDIGFVDNVLDTSTLESFCGGTNGFVKTWYDQSGNATDATQTALANQPKIVSSGSTITEGGMPAILNTSATGFKTSVNVNFAAVSSISGVSVHKTASGSFQVIAEHSTNYNSFNQAFVSYIESGKYWMGQKVIGGYIVNTHSPNSVLRELANFYFKTLQPNTTFSSVYANNSLLTRATSYASTSVAFSSFPMCIYARNGRSNGLIGTFQEFIIYPNDQSANQGGINTNVNDFYTIY